MLCVWYIKGFFKMAAPNGARLSPSAGLLQMRYIWLGILLLAPFLMGGVVSGDEAFLLSSAHGVDNSHLSFAQYARSAEGWYIPHHILWFYVVYSTAHIAAFLHAGALLTEAIISIQTVIAALAGIALCYDFLVKRMKMPPERSAWTVLALFAGGYGVFTFCLAGTPESYMVLIMSARLFLTEPGMDRRQARQLAILDAVLIGIKAYSPIFLVASLPVLGASPQFRMTYLRWLAAPVLLLIAVKLWLWNPSPLYYGSLSRITAPDYSSHFLQQFFSPWTGLFFCLPILLMLFWHEKLRRRSLLFKGVGVIGCAACFSLYPFFDGDIAGGRYIFPFVISLLPEIGGATSRLLDRQPRLAWLLPIAVLAFLPVAMFGFPFFMSRGVQSRGACVREHPVVYSWKIAIAKAARQPQVEICFHNEKYVIGTRDVASPHLGFWRIAYLLDGGHSDAYRKTAHDAIQRQHDIQGDRLADMLKKAGLGNPGLWRGLGLMPGILLVLLSILAAVKINRSAAQNP